MLAKRLSAIQCMITMLLLFNIYSLFAGEIRGKVIDKLTSEGLPGANVIIQGTNLGAATNMEGEYYIHKVSPGSFKLKVTYIGYRSLEKEVVVKAQGVSNLNFELEYDVIEGETISITAQAEGQIAAINQQLSSRSIVNVVSKARIEELPDANAAETVGRLPGVSIIRDSGEGNKVAIRGMEPKLNLVTINGVRMPATDLNSRSVDLSMISPNMLDGIELVKALTPDKDADAIGGTIDFKLKKAPKLFGVNILAQKGYNDHRESFDPFKIYGSISNRFFNNKLGVIASGNIERADRSSDQISAGYNVQGDPEPGQQYVQTVEINNLSLYDQYITRDRFGGSLILDYEMKNGNLMWSNIYNKLDHESDRYADQISAENREHRYRYNRDVYHVNFINSSLSGDNRFPFFNMDYTMAFAQSSRKYDTDYDIMFNESAGLISPMPRDQGPEILSGYAKNRLEETAIWNAYRYENENLERDLTAILNFDVPFQFTSFLSGNLEFGGKYRSKYRELDKSRWFIPYFWGTGNEYFPSIFPDMEAVRTSNGYWSGAELLDVNHDAGNFLDGDYDFGFAPDKELMLEIYDRVPLTQYYYQPAGDRDDHNITENITAAYIMTTINIGKRLMILPGVRYESENTDLTGYMTDDQDEDEYRPGLIDEIRIAKKANRFTDKWFPMLHMRYKFTNWLDVRLAGTTSTIRPSFNRLIPSSSVNLISQNYYRGNPNLKPATARNLDMSLSAYQNKFGLLTISGFYKEVDDLFYTFQRDLLTQEMADEVFLSQYKGYRLTDSINNPYTAFVRGVEIDLQTQLSFLPGIMKGVVLNVNYSKMSSDTRYPYSVVNTLTFSKPPWFEVVRVDTSRAGRMLRQSNDLANIAIGYDYKGFSGRLSILYQGNTLNGLGDRPETDGITEDLLRFDLSVKQEIGWGMQIYMNMNNISNRPDRSFEPVHKFITSGTYYGMTADLGIRYRL